MKLTIKHFLAPAAALLLASCASPIERRIETNPKLYQALPPAQQQKVQQGEIAEGMSKQAVFLAWGRPDRAAKGSKNGKTYERWSYTGYSPTTVGYGGVGYGYGGWGYGGGFGWGGYYRPYGYYDPIYFYEPAIDLVPYEARRVEFQNNRVTEYSRTR